MSWICASRPPPPRRRTARRCWTTSCAGPASPAATRPDPSPNETGSQPERDRIPARRISCPRMRLLLALAALAGSAIPAAAASVSAPVAIYSVEAGDGARELRVEATFTEGPSGGGLEFEEGMGRYVREAQAASGKTWTAAALEEDTLRTTCHQGCRVRYVFLLEEAAKAARNRNAAF